MSRTLCLPNNPPHFTEHVGPSSIYIYTYNPTVLKPRTRRPPLTSHRDYWTTKPTYTCTRPPSPRRHPHPPNPRTNYHRNHQPLHPTNRPRSSSHSQPNSRPPTHFINRQRRLRPPFLHANHCTAYLSSPSPFNPSRSCSCYNSSLRLRSAIKPLPPRKRLTLTDHLMAHQAHAYHIVDPSP